MKEMDMAENMPEEEIDIDEIELTLRRFAMKKNDQPLTKLLNSLFTQPIEEEKDSKEEGED